MADDDVTPADPSPAAASDTSDPNAPESVISDREERPVENLAAEVNRKFGRLERQMSDLLTYVATQRPQAQQADVPKPNDVSDDDLYRLAQQGDRAAFDLYVERKAGRTSQQSLLDARRQAAVEGQMSALMQKYPVLNDASHPLTQAANQAYALLIQTGYPAGRATLLEAAKTAIADRPDIVSELHATRSRAGENQRVSAASRAQQGVTGASYREDPRPVRPNVKMSPDEAALAKRMGISDPAKAKERFLKRQESGQSQLGAVISHVNTDNF